MLFYLYKEFNIKKKFLHYIKEIALFLVVMSIFANILSLYKSQDLNKKKLPLNTTRLIDNSIYNPPNDKPIAVHFWATWCPVCKLEADNIERLSKYYEVVSIAVNSGSDYDIHNYLKESNLNYRVINDKDGAIAQEFGVAVYPTTFIYDRNRSLTFSEVGYTSSFGLFSRMIYSSFK